MINDKFKFKEKLDKKRTMQISDEIRKLMAEGYQLSPEASLFLSKREDQALIVKKILEQKLQVIVLKVEDIKNILSDIEDNAVDIDKEESYKEMATDNTAIKTINSSYENKIETISQIRKRRVATDLKVLYTPKIETTKSDVNIFRAYFLNRYEKIYNMFRSRADIQNVMSLDYLSSKRYVEQVSVVGMVNSKTTTKNGSVIIELEDKNGRIKAIIPSSQKSIVAESEYILEDTVIALSGSWDKSVLFCNNIYWPDIPFNRKNNYSSEEVYSLFISDIHVGSKEFLDKLFKKAIDFINGSTGKTRLRQLGKKIKYLFVGGDIVDGVGVYPNQEEDLLIKNVREQYSLIANYLEMVDPDVDIIIIPGNHDASRAAEPQTPITKDFADELYNLNNIHMLGSPSYVKTHNVEVLMYHGNSIYDINAAIPSIPNESAIPAVKQMVRNRHIVPLYGKKTSIAPTKEDALVIDRIPDIIHVGHTHLTESEVYKGVLLISSGTFQSQTEYQRSMNINPTPGKTYVVNLMDLQRIEIDFQSL